MKKIFLNSRKKRFHVEVLRQKELVRWRLGGERVAVPNCLSTSFYFLTVERTPRKQFSQQKKTESHCYPKSGENSHSYVHPSRSQTLDSRTPEILCTAAVSLPLVAIKKKSCRSSRFCLQLT